MTPIDADRAFALEQVSQARRAAIGALWRLDAALGAVIAGGREPLISRIKLAWWRDSLEALDGAGPPAEPVLQEVAAALIPAGIAGSELAAMEQGWQVLLSAEALTSDELDRYAAARGAALFRLAARLLGGHATPEIERAGEAWALTDLARHSNRADAESALRAASVRSGAMRWPRPLRPLGMLAVLAQRDAARGIDALEPPGVPPRLARMLRHRLTGR
jgi:phytoene synthase